MAHPLLLTPVGADGALPEVAVEERLRMSQMFLASGMHVAMPL
jgi:hypothetical protein